MVHICPEKGTVVKKASKFDAVPTEFFSLSDWMQQSTMFNVLTSMKYFKHYLIGKVFGLWKGNVRFKMFNRTRQNLAQSLIYARPAFLGPFLDINKTLFEMASVRTFSVPKINTKSYDLEPFMEEQKVERVDRNGCVKQHYNDRVDEIIKKLENMVTFVSESRSLREEEDMEHAKMGQANKNKSMVLQKQEDELKARVLRLARKNYNSLGTFIRLIDYMVTETQVRINQESIELILYEMNNTKRYNINTQVSFDIRENGLSYNPTKSDFVAAFSKLLDEMENVAGEILRIISHAAFNQFIQGLISDGGGKFKDIVAESFKCRASKDAITSKIESDFRSLSNDVSKIENCREVHDFTQLNFEKDLKPQFTDLDSIKVWIDRLTNWEKIIQQNIRT